MSLVRPRLTALHVLQAANPELSVEQLHWLLDLSARDDEEEEGAGAEEGGGGVQGQAPGAGAQEQAGAAVQQQQMQGAEASELSEQQQQQPEQQPDAEGEQDIPLPRWRGPRPAYVPGTQEPSPSAYPPPSEQRGGS